MTMPFASGKDSIAICDRCGEFKPYKELKRQIIAQRDSGLRVCDDCWDPDQPQWLVGKWPVVDPMALQFPRPDPCNDRGLYGFNPLLGIEMVSSIGNVQVSTS